MYIRKDTDIGDVWPWYDEVSGLTHLYFLTAPSGTGRHWSIGHLVSRDLVDWEDRGIALAPGRSGCFDDFGLATGSIIRHDGRYYMAYTGHSCDETLGKGDIGLAVSDDLDHWERVSENPVVVHDPRYYETEITGSRPFLHWRDPFLLREDDGIHMFLCARRLDGPVKTRGTVAHLVSRDLLQWQTLPPLEVSPLCEEMECPLVHKHGGRYYLFFSTHQELIDPAALAGEKVPDGGFFVQTADTLTGPWRRNGTGKIDLPEVGGYFYAHQLVNRPQGCHLLGTVITPERSWIADPVPVEFRPDGLAVR